ncbi:MAG TPA: DUF4118 domain-containing protein [Candidatus Limnocylindrales bacterium]|nr:DUF4118 domain-containing protein [Candidatus Limnocylindrales bacterium]
MAAHDTTPVQTARPGAIASIVALPLVVRVTLVVGTLVAATAAVAVLEHTVGVADASPLYLIAVVLAAALLGTWGAVATSVVAFLVYDFTFTSPRFTFVVADPAEWLNLLLFLLVAVVLGQVTALLRDRADEADRRARESEALVAISRDIALAGSFEEAAVAVATRLRRDAEMASIRVVLADRPDVPIAETGVPPDDAAGLPWTLVRAAPDGGSDWLRVVDGSTPPAAGVGGLADRYSVAIGPGDRPVGWIHATRVAGDPMPGRGARRLLTLAADQLGIAHRRDELRAEATAAEVARQSDALRGAILDSVSHDLRTPIASIRALAGGLADPATSPDLPTVRATAAEIDAQGARLADLVNGLLDMGRIQAGAVRAELRPYDLRELVETTLRRAAVEPGAPSPVVDVPDDLPPVLADAVLFDGAFGNVIANAAAHAPGAAARVTARVAPDAGIVLAVDDAGPGVPDETLSRVFERFYRGAEATPGARRGLGMGLAIAKGFTEAMGGSILASRSELGGLRVELHLLAAGELEAE